MSPAEARLAGVIPPEGYVRPPRASFTDAARTGFAVASLAGQLARVGLRGSGGPAPASTTADGLALIRRFCLDQLARVGVRLEVLRAESVPADGGLVFMWNQASHLDHLVVPPAMPRPFHSIYNNAVHRTPLYGKYMARQGHFWVDRTDEAQWRAQIAIVAERVRQGACVLVSPEGTRSWDGRLLPMKRGAFLLARQASRPIVCVTVVGAHDRLPRGGVAVRPGPVRVVFGDPLPVSSGDPTLEAQVIATFDRLLEQHRLHD